MAATTNRADVLIFDENNNQIASQSTDQDVFYAIGNCILKQDDVIMIITKALVLAPGSYFAYSKRPRFGDEQAPPSQRDEYRP